MLSYFLSLKYVHEVAIDVFDMKTVRLWDIFEHALSRKKEVEEEDLRLKTFNYSNSEGISNAP